MRWRAVLAVCAEWRSVRLAVTYSVYVTFSMSKRSRQSRRSILLMIFVQPSAEVADGSCVRAQLVSVNASIVRIARVFYALLIFR